MGCNLYVTTVIGVKYALVTCQEWTGEFMADFQENGVF